MREVLKMGMISGNREERKKHQLIGILNKRIVEVNYNTVDHLTLTVVSPLHYTYCTSVSTIASWGDLIIDGRGREEGKGEWGSWLLSVLLHIVSDGLATRHHPHPELPRHTRPSSRKFQTSTIFCSLRA
jgi:hypothetical protein